jgi:radical SAM enzyme (TIGR01210 family)
MPGDNELPTYGASRLRLDDRWIVEQRGPRNSVDPVRPYAYSVEPERTADGAVEDVATIFITNRECPFRCLMCDLWRNTTVESVPLGAVPAQIEWALGRLTPARHIKLYNSGNFFDAKAIPPADWPRITELVQPYQTVIVESHPRLIDERCAKFAEMLEPRLEVAMGLETVDPGVLPRLNKRMTLADYDAATEFLLAMGIAVRAFILLRTPFQSEEAGLEWAKRSLGYAFSIGVECCTVIPTRSGNGAIDRLQEEGHFEPPTLRSLEAVVQYGIDLGRGRVFADLWDIERTFRCPDCGPERAERLRQMNLKQEVLPAVSCGCGT